MKHRYEWVAFDSALALLRPGAKWKLDHGKLIWEDPRPMPTLDEISNVINKIRDFEESIDYILLPDQVEEDDPAQRPEGVVAGIDMYDPNASSDGGTYLGDEGRAGIGGVPAEQL
jgi:hypothetical protein